MNLKLSPNRKTGRTYLSIVQGYREKETGKSKARIIQSLGYLDELEKQYPDPISHFREVARKMTEEENARRKVVLTLDMDETIPKDSNNHKNLGYAALLKIYYSFGLMQFLTNASRKHKFDFNVNSIVCLLVISRILSPGSKKKAFEGKGRFFERFDFELVDIYRSLSFLASIDKDVQRQINNAIAASSPRDTSLVYYDVTNFYFEISEEDDFRKKGYSKEKRRDPIVQMGLAMDRDGIPLHYDLFAGNTPDTLTFRAVVGEVRRNYDTGRIVVVADRGITSGDNIFYLAGGEKKAKTNNGYIFSYSISGSTDEFKSFVLDSKGYYDPSGKPVSADTDFMIKSRKSYRDIQVTMKDGKKSSKTVYEKHVVFWSHKHAQKAKLERDKLIAKAMAMIADPSKLKRASANSAARLIRDITYDESSGEVIQTGKHPVLDMDKIEQEAKFDGYYAIVTSEHELPDTEIIGHYRGLWEIEETFRITKGVLEGRPVHVSREDRIRAHFLICYISLVVMRLLQREAGRHYSCERIVEALKNTSCTLEHDNIFLFGYRSEVTDAIGEALSIDFSKKRMRLQDIRSLLTGCKRQQ